MSFRREARYKCEEPKENLFLICLIEKKIQIYSKNMLENTTKHGNHSCYYSCQYPSQKHDLQADIYCKTSGGEKLNKENKKHLNHNCIACH
jgi:hypothetical protein